MDHLQTKDRQISLTILLVKNLNKERYITREKCIEWCGNSWLASIDDSAAIKKKNYTKKFFHDSFSKTGMVQLKKAHSRTDFGQDTTPWY